MFWGDFSTELGILFQGDCRLGSLVIRYATVVIAASRHSYKEGNKIFRASKLVQTINIVLTLKGAIRPLYWDLGKLFQFLLLSDSQ